MNRADKIQLIKDVISGKVNLANEAYRKNVADMTDEEIDAEIARIEALYYDPEVDIYQLDSSEQVALMKILVKYDSSYLSQLDKLPLLPDEKETVKNIRRVCNGQAK
jgi:hypothetical protein